MGVTRDKDAHEETLLTRIGISEAVVRQSVTLALSWKQLVPTDVPLLTAVLPTAVDLEELDLRHNKLADAGVAALASGLSQSGRKLHTVLLARNAITDKGGKAIAAYLGDAKASGGLKTPT